MSTSVEQRLKELGITLPEAPAPAANYRPFTRTGSLLFVAGQLPITGGELSYIGHVGSELTEEQGYEAARACALNVLAQIHAALGGFDDLVQLVRIDGHVASAPGFTGQPRVVNGASDLFAEVLGERGTHCRVALGHNELPLGAAVEIAAIAAVREL